VVVDSTTAAAVIAALSCYSSRMKASTTEKGLKG
jgi:hypothetical protein